VAGLDHFLVLTDDIEGTRDFWCGALDLRVGERPPLEFPGYWLYAGEVPCVHVAERAAFGAHSQRIGIAAAPNEVPGMRQLFLEDPNGVKIEINVKEPS
jgi:catechol 2,3-dioxygenase-like lactoylglutathione lyase family enzyme